MAYILNSVLFSCVCLYRVENGGNKLLTNLSYHCIAFGIDILYFVFVIGLVIIICGIIVDVRVRFTMVALVSFNSNTSFGSTFIASVSIFHPRIYFWELSLFNEAILKPNLKNFNEQLAQSTARYR